MGFESRDSAHGAGLDPTFDEKTYGVATFSALLKKHEAVLEVRKGQYDQEYRLKEAGGK